MPPDPLVAHETSNLIGVLDRLPDVLSTLWPYLGRDPWYRVIGLCGRLDIHVHVELDRLDRLPTLIAQAGVHGFLQELGPAVGIRNGR